MALPASIKVKFRGGTARFTTNFYDFDDNLVNPQGAVINLKWPLPGGEESETQITMTPPVSGYDWTALWDSRGAGVGTVAGSVHSIDAGGIPIAVGDFQFSLAANEANLETF